MKSREKLLKNVLMVTEEFYSSLKEIQKYPWDLELPLIELSREDVCSVFARALVGEIAFSQIEEWAEFIEFRDDIELSDEMLAQVIHELANPTIFVLIDEFLIEKKMAALGCKNV